MPKRLKGINQDVDPIDQPQGTYRDALNAVVNKKKGAIVNEGGTVQKDVLPTGYNVIGKTLVYDGRHVLFLTDGTSSEIGSFDGSSYTKVLDDSDIPDGKLDFPSGGVIEAANLINDNGEVVVYWTDNENVPRYYNIDSNESISTIDSLNIFPTISDSPDIDLDGVNTEGGVLDTGAYHFAIALYAEDGSRTNYMSLTNPVYVSDDSDITDHDNYDGEKAGTQTSKSIRLSIENLDQAYEKYELVVIRKEGGTVASVEKLPKKTIESNSTIFTYGGNEATIEASLDDIIINTADYDTAKTIVEQDDSLYLGNLSKKEDIGYQKYANNITVSSEVSDLSDNGSGLQDRDHYGNPVLSFYDKSFKRGGVYAFYISFVLKSGVETQAYHIPGRQSDGGDSGTIDSIDRYRLRGDDGTNNMGYWENADESYPSAGDDENGDWEVWTVDSNGDGQQVSSGETTLHGKSVRHHHFPDALNEGFEPYGVDGKFAKKLGVSFSDVRIPSDILDKITAVKFYFAERTDNNKRVVDQGIVVPMKETDMGDDIGIGYSVENDTFTSKYVRFQGFNALRTKKNIGSVNYLKIIADQHVSASTPDENSDNNKRIFWNPIVDQTVYNGSLVPVNAKTYIAKNSIVEATSKGFPFDIGNFEGEEGIGLYLDSEINWDCNYSRIAGNVVNCRIAEMMQVLTNLYSPFERQQLVQMGSPITQLDKFDASVDGSSGGGKAFGYIDITNGINPLAPNAEAVIAIESKARQTGEFAEGHIEVTANSLSSEPSTGHIDVTANNLASSSSEDHQITVGSDTTASITVSDADTLEDIVDKYVAEINGDANISANWTASKVDSGGTWRCLIEGVDGDESLDDTTISISGDTDIDTTVESPTSGADDGEEDHIVSVDGNDTASVTISEADTAEDIVTKYRDAINADATISADWTATVDDSSGEWRCIITADAAGTSENGTVVDVTGESEVILTVTNSAGGVDPDASAGDYTVSIDAYYENFSVTIAIDNNADKDTVATQIADGLNNSTIFNVAYEAEADLSPSNPTITITAKRNGTKPEATLTLNNGDTEVTSSKDGDIDGGVAGEADNDYLIDGIDSIGHVEVTGSPDSDTSRAISLKDGGTTIGVVVVDLLTTDSPEDVAEKIYDAFVLGEDVTGDPITGDFEDFRFALDGAKVYYYAFERYKQFEGVEFNMGSPATFSHDVQECTHGWHSDYVATGETTSIEGLQAAFYINNSEIQDKEIIFSVAIGDSDSDIESKMLAAIQADSAFTNLYDAEINNGRLEVTAKNNGNDYNGGISLRHPVRSSFIFDEYETTYRPLGIEFSFQHLEGGEDTEVQDQFTVSSNSTGNDDSRIGLSGDTYIGFYGTRISAHSANVDGITRHLFYAVCESEDNIKLRHAGDGYGEKYFPKSDFDTILRLEDDAPEEQEDEIFDNFIGYNPDYTALGNIKTAVPALASKSDIQKFPTRVIRSNEGDSSSDREGIRTFLENDYMDLTRSRGELITLNVVNNTLIPHMERGLIKTKGREELVTGDFRAFLGAGDIFSVKPDEIISTKEGFGGTQDPKTAITTPYGYFFVDREAQQVILLSDSPEVISNRGLRNFFQKELADCGDDELIASWDTAEERILLTRIGEWTLSYYPKHEGWMSFYSYTPDYYLNTVNSLFSIDGGAIHKHHDENSPCTFYGTTYDFMFEFVSNPEPAATKHAVNIELITEVSDNSDKYYKETFDKFRVQNRYQDSGERTISYFTGASGNARHVEGTWRINKFRDLLDDNGLIDGTLPWYEQGRFIGKYAKVKLIYNNSANKFIYLFDSKVNFKRSVR